MNKVFSLIKSSNTHSAMNVSTQYATKLLLALLILVSTACEGFSDYGSMPPSRFESSIKAFEQADKNAFPPSNGILFLGSSSIRAWAPTLATDMTPLSVIPRGFGGSNMNDALYYVDRIVLPYKPRAIVLYEGENDIRDGIPPAKILETYQQFVRKVRAELPNCRIYFMSIKPTPARWGGWPVMQEANRLIEAETQTDDAQFYIDVSSGMLGASGEPKTDIYLSDNIHMNNKGYQIWTGIIAPILHKTELELESN